MFIRYFGYVSLLFVNMILILPAQYRKKEHAEVAQHKGQYDHSKKICSCVISHLQNGLVNALKWRKKGEKRVNDHKGNIISIFNSFSVLLSKV